ncbi:NIPSNAP family protein [Amycolatopsis mongoliensis]|uniref:NIPSNAP family protein n=1 Tax=Amycolatopsis mongoliensis TaxID=715475 RepID=A0A9Y2JPN3_9PSEU|nr:NIPSNAP family protein [Amycolatopsis sp. 4-36]WIY01107.1 NIPSNAP family protein [Amycolatopsis sp. 4-36]
MIVEERNYQLVPGGARRYLDAWHRQGRGPQVAHLGEPLGVYTVEVGALNTLVYLWGFPDQADRAARRARLAGDPAFAAFRGEVRSLLVAQSNRILVPATPPEGRP